MRYTSYFLSLITITFFLAACGGDQTNRPAPDVSHLSAEVELVRYDQLLRNIDSDNPQQSYLDLISEHPAMTDLYFKQLTSLYEEDQDKFYNNVSEFSTDNRITSLADTVSSVYGDMKAIESNLEQALKYLKHYFPSYEAPRFYTIFSEFSYQSFIFADTDGRDAVGLGLDLFLGGNFDYKKVDPSNPAFSAYLSRAYNSDHLPKKAIEMLVEDLIGKPDGKRFLDLMIHQGKKQYILERLMPHSVDTILWEYTPAQMDWVKSNELQMWDFFLDRNLIYETSHLKTAHYLQPAPTSKGMPDVAPGRTGGYMGYKIISALMKRKPNLSLKGLVELKNSQSIMEEARYKPARK